MLVDKIATAGRTRGVRVDEPDQGLGAFRGAASERPRDRHADAHQEAVVAIEAGGHESRMEAVSGDASTGQPACQLAREENIRQLGLAIARKPAAAPGALRN